MDDDLVAQQLLAHFASAATDGAPEDQGIASSPTSDAISDLTSEIEQLRDYGIFKAQTPRSTITTPRAATMSPTRSEVYCIPAEYRDLAAALAWCDSTLQHDPRNCHIYLERAKIHFKLGDFEAAVRDGIQSTKVNSDFQRGYSWAGGVLLKLGRFAEAEAQLAALASPPDWNVPHVRRQWEAAQQAFAAGQFEECAKTLEAVVPHTTHSVEVKRLFVAACEKAGRWGPVPACLAEWMGQPPFAADPYWRYMCAAGYFHTAQLADCLRLLDGDAAIEAAYKEAHGWRRSCESLQSAILVAQLDVQQHEHQKAYSGLTQAMAGITPMQKQLLHMHRADVLSAWSADCRQIIEETTQALEQNTCPWSAHALALRAKAYVEQNELALAIEDYERLLKIHPDDRKSGRELQRLREIIPDLYAILKVPADCTVKRLNTAYHRLVLQYHPDRQFGQTDEERRRTKVKFHELYETFMLLSDPTKRAQYDEYVGMELLPPQLSLMAQVCRAALTVVALSALGALAYGSRRSLARWLEQCRRVVGVTFLPGGLRFHLRATQQNTIQ